MKNKTQMDFAQVFSVIEGGRKRDEAIDCVEASNAEFVEMAYLALIRVSRNKKRFTTDDVWAVLYEWGIYYAREPRAMGAVMVRGRKEGVISPTDTHTMSKRSACHRRPLRVWISVVPTQGEQGGNTNEHAQQERSGVGRDGRPRSDK